MPPVGQARIASGIYRERLGARRLKLWEDRQKMILNEYR
jgi:hypothetical protein